MGNTVHQIPGLEKQNKVGQKANMPPFSKFCPSGKMPHLQLDRVSTSATTLTTMGHTGTMERRPSVEESGHSLDSRRSTGRAKTDPTLSMSIPLYAASNKPSMKLSGSHGTSDILPTACVSSQKDEDHCSETSSICQSPGWKGYDERKGKKQKHQARGKRRPVQDGEKTTAENEAKPARKVKGNLSKPPSTHKRLTKMGSSMDRPISASMFNSSSDLTDLRDGPLAGANRSRRGSLDIGLKSLIQATHAIPVPWKSSKPNQSQETQQSTPAGGFIGGFKLRGEAAIRIEIPNQDLPNYSSEHHVVKDTSCRRLSLSGVLIENSHRQQSDSGPTHVSSFEIQGSRSVPATQQEDSICNKASHAIGTAAKPRNPSQTSPSSPIMDRNVKKGHTNDSLISETPPLETRTKRQQIPSDHNFASSALLKRQDGSKNSPKIPSSSSTAVSFERSLTNSQDSSIKNGGIPLPFHLRTERGDIRHFLRQSTDHASDSSRDDRRVSMVSAVVLTTSPSSRRTSSSSPNSRRYNVNSGEESNRVGMSINLERTDEGHGNKGNVEYTDFWIDDYTPPKQQFLTPEARTTPTKADTLRHRRQSLSGPAVSSLKGLKKVATAAFSRSSNLTSSTTLDFFNSGQRLASNKLQSLSRSSMVIDDGQMPSLSKAHRILRKSISSAVTQESTGKLSVSSGGTSSFSLPKIQTYHDTVDWTSKEFLEPLAVSAGTRIRSAHSTWMTESSEDSTWNESSRITTPAVCRMPSQREIIPKVRESTSRLNPTEVADNFIPDSEALPNGGVASMLSGDVLNEETADSCSSSPGSWSRTALPFELKDEDEPLKILTSKEAIVYLSRKGKSSLTNRAGPSYRPSNPSNYEASAGGIHHQSNIPVSASRTDSDLSFLPALKHQALTRSTDGKVQPDSTITAKESLPQRDHETPPIRSFVNPPTLSTHVASAPPASPVGGSRYLRDARSSIPRATRHSTNIAPVAKMFVICCSCRYFHDMPSKIYECMAKPENIVTDRNLGVSGVVSTAVKCPWCAHGMSTTCCSGYAAVVYLQEKLH